jgi:hypothetical protein
MTDLRFDGMHALFINCTLKRGTRLTNAMDMRPSGVLGVVAPVATFQVKAAVAENLAVLKQLLESRSASSFDRPR